MSLKKNLLYNFLLSLSQVIFPLVSIPYISRVLDPTGIGKVGTIDSLTYYFIVIAELGITSYAIREVARRKNDHSSLSKLVSELFSLHLIASSAAIALYAICVGFLFQKISDIRLILFSISFLLVNAFACEWYYWGREKFKYITIRSLAARVLGLASIFILVKQPDDYLIYYAIIVCSGIISLVWNFSRLTSEVQLSFKNINWRSHLPFLKITYSISLAYSVVLMLDNVFLGLLSSAAAVAFYAFAAKVVRIGGALVTDTLLVFYPRTVSLLHQQEHDALQETINKSIQIILLTTIPMAFGIYLFSEKFTSVYFGDAFLPVADNLKLLALYPLLKSSSLFIDKQLLMPYDKEKLVLRGLTLGAVVFIACTIPLSILYADKGTSIAVIIAELSVLAANVFYARNLISVRFFNSKTALQAIAGSLLFIPVMFLGNYIFENGLLQLLFLIIVSVVLYALFLLVTRNDLFLSVLKSYKSNSIIKREGQEVGSR